MSTISVRRISRHHRRTHVLADVSVRNSLMVRFDHGSYSSAHPHPSQWQCVATESVSSLPFTHGKPLIGRVSHSFAALLRPLACTPWWGFGACLALDCLGFEGGMTDEKEGCRASDRCDWAHTTHANGRLPPDLPYLIFCPRLRPGGTSRTVDSPWPGIVRRWSKHTRCAPCWSPRWRQSGPRS